MLIPVLILDQLEELFSLQTEEARQILRRLQYSSKETEAMIRKALESNLAFETIEGFLNEIYRQRKA